MSAQKPDPYPHMSREEIDRITGGGILRMIPAVRLVDMLRGKSKPVCPQCAAPVLRFTTVCRYCGHEHGS